MSTECLHSKIIIISIDASKRNPALKCGLGQCSVTCSMFFSVISWHPYIRLYGILDLQEQYTSMQNACRAQQ